MYLPYISDKDLIKICSEVISKLKASVDNKEKDLHKNIIDPFSAVFEASYNNISLAEWIEREKSRQIQKTFQNAIGDFHQQLLGRVYGWEDLGKGNLVDLKNTNKKIIAEIKNKFNTTKGNHRVAVYDDIETLLKREYVGYTGYYVAILNKKKLNQPFTPSDNKTHSKRIENEAIREVDGATFYEIATGAKKSITMLYDILPIVLNKILGNNAAKLKNDPLFQKLFFEAFK